MLVDRVLRDLDLPDGEQGGNPLRGSRLGRCARQSAYMLFPEAYPPAPLPARAKLVFTFGNMIHEWVRAEFRRVCKGEWGYEEGRFWFTVPLDVPDARAAGKLVMDKRLRAKVNTTGPAFGDGLVLDIATPALYIPLHVDGIADCEGTLASAEIKSMATGSFKRALAGHVEYSYRVQMAAAVDATGLDAALYVAVRKDTSHLLEVFYSKAVSDVRVAFTKNRYVTTMLNLEAGEPADWEAAEVRHPFEPHLLEQARDRVRRILRSTLTTLPEREYGPDFTCPTCEGTGIQSKAKTTGKPLKHGPRDCQDCREGGEGSLGVTPRAELPFQCRYCPYTAECWPFAKLEIEGERPHFWVDRQAFEDSGVTFRSPE